METSEIVVLLPACTFPTEDSDCRREAALQANLHYIGEQLPDARIVVCDNGRRPPGTPATVTIIHSDKAFSNDPSIGECRNLLNGLHGLDDEVLVIKLHARCELLNFAAFKAYFQKYHEFFLVSPNIWGCVANGYDGLPYIDTRVFAARAGTLRRLLTDTLALLETNGGRIEQAMLAVVLRRPADCAIIHTRGPFFPILGGTAGHGRNYSNPAALIRSHIKSLIYRSGL